MAVKIGIRREDKNEWERRVPLVPADLRALVRDHGLSFTVQPHARRVFPEREFEEAGARIDEDLSGCGVVLGVKEMPLSVFREGCAYVFFAHVIKGQPYNMGMLRTLLDRGASLLDYEKITDEAGRRLVFFGRHAGLAGMIDTLRALGARLDAEGVSSPFSGIRSAHAYANLDEACKAVRDAGEAIRRDGLPPGLTPFVCGFTGYGNVSKGAQEIFDLLPVREVSPDALPGPGEGSDREVCKVVFREEDMVAPRTEGASFELQDYYDHPEKYESRFDRYLPRLTLLVNAIYWDERYPRLVTRESLRALFGGPAPPRLKVIGDISSDVEGSIEITVKCTDPGNPTFTVDPETGAVRDGVEGRGPVVLAVDNLPAELPREASVDFSAVLRDFVPALAASDFSREDPGLPGPLMRALIVRRGTLTPDFRYLEKHL